MKYNVGDKIVVEYPVLEAEDGMYRITGNGFLTQEHVDQYAIDLTAERAAAARDAEQALHWYAQAKEARAWARRYYKLWLSTSIDNETKPLALSTGIEWICMPAAEYEVEKKHADHIKSLLDMKRDALNEYAQFENELILAMGYDPENCALSTSDMGEIVEIVQNSRIPKDIDTIRCNLVEMSALADRVELDQARREIERMKAERDAALEREHVLRVGLNTAIVERNQAVTDHECCCAEYKRISARCQAQARRIAELTVSVTNPTIPIKYDHSQDKT